MKIIALVNGMDSYCASSIVAAENRNCQITSVWYDLGLPYSKRIGDSLPQNVTKISMTKFASVVGYQEVDGEIFSPLAHEFILHDALVRFDPDKIIMGVLPTDAHDRRNTMNWVNEFNDKIGRPVLDYPLVRNGLNKIQALKQATLFGMSLAKIQNINTCKATEAKRFGCGGCESCIRKRSAIMASGKPSFVPSSIDSIKESTTIDIDNYANEYMSFNITEEKQARADEFLVALERDFEIEDDPMKLSKKIKRQHRKLNRQ